MTRYADTHLTALKRALQAAGEAQQIPASTALTRYAIERFVRRVSAVENPNKREIVMRGGVLLNLWHPDVARPSTTLDLLTRRPMDDAALGDWLRSVCAVDDSADGLVFEPDSILLRDTKAPGGFRTRRASLGVLLGRQRTQLQLCVAYQRDLLPQPQEQVLGPLLPLDMPAARLWSSAKESVLAEKLHMVHVLGRQPSYKDIYDMHMLLCAHTVVGGPMMAAIKSTFDQHISSITERPPHALALEHVDEGMVNAGWNAFMRQLGGPAQGKPWRETVTTLHAFFTPVWDHLVRQKPFASTWHAEEGWT